MGDMDFDFLDIDKSVNRRKKNRIKKDHKTVIMVATGCVAACALILAISIGLYKWVTEEVDEAANMDEPILYTQEEMEEKYTVEQHLAAKFDHESQSLMEPDHWIPSFK